MGQKAYICPRPGVQMRMGLGVPPAFFQAPSFRPGVSFPDAPFPGAPHIPIPSRFTLASHSSPWYPLLVILSVAKNLFSSFSFNHLLFLPTTGFRIGWDVTSMHSTGVYWSTIVRTYGLSVRFRDVSLQLPYTEWVHRGMSVRLVSVVSELTFVGKKCQSVVVFNHCITFVILRAAKNLFSHFRSNPHLLFLPAAGYRHSGNAFRYQNEWVSWRTPTGMGFIYTPGRNGTSTKQFSPVCAGNAVRLASVVSELTKIPKSFSNTHFNHLLFLPAAGWRDAPGIGMQSRAVSLWTSTAQAVGSAYWLRTTEKEFLLQGIASWLFSAVRLASVVSELTFVGKKCQSVVVSNHCITFVILRAAKNLFSHFRSNPHLLFLPAAGFRRGDGFTTVGGMRTMGVYVIFRALNYPHLVCAPNMFQSNYYDPAYDGRSVRLVSVVSGLAFTKKSDSKTYLFHLLFLPAAGLSRFFFGDYVAYFSVSSVGDSEAYTAYAHQKTFRTDSAYWTRNVVRSVRLVSVVSELAVAQKSISTTYRFHLLFLPAAGYFNGVTFSAGGGLFWHSNAGANGRGAYSSFNAASVTVSKTFQAYMRNTVRLASVVSGLPHVAKSISNTYFGNHLLFLPAVVWLQGQKSGEGTWREFPVFWAVPDDGSARPQAVTFWFESALNFGALYASSRAPIRLVSVVSELTHVQKFLSNTHSNHHLLFLPAAGCISVRYGFQRDQVFHYTTIASGFVNAYFMMYAAGNFKVNADARTGRLSIRLASVVSGLAFTKKSDSKTYLFHLLFLPAATVGHWNLSSRDGGYYHSVSFHTGSNEYNLAFTASGFQARSDWWAQVCARKSVRLASVVSELTFVGKKCQSVVVFNHCITFVILRAAKNLFSHFRSNPHLLFLPAAGRLDAVNFQLDGVRGEYGLASSHEGHCGDRFLFDSSGVKVLFEGYRYQRRSVRLASVVSELTSAPKSLSNIHSNHLLFLPAPYRLNGIRLEYPLAGWYYAVDGGRRIVLADGEVAIAGEPRHLRESIRLASVVSELTSAPKSLSNTHSNYLLFLPAAGYVYNGSTYEKGNDRLFYTTLSAESASSYYICDVQATRFVIMKAWYGRQERCCVRLVSVVSELTSAPKSLSNTHSNHLLFLPAAGTSRSDNLGAYFSIIGSAGDVATFLFSAKSYYCTHGAQLARDWHRSVRLASVVSELPCVPKSHSKTCPFHLLFLPAAGARNSVNFAVGGRYSSAVTTGSMPYTVLFGEANFFAKRDTGVAPFWGNSVRLASVVSESFFFQKSFSNTCCHYLLFLPANPLRYCWDKKWSSDIYVGYQATRGMDASGGPALAWAIKSLSIADDFWQRLSAKSVRLASVVSASAFVQKSFSKTYSNHLLFLPAAGTAYGAGFFNNPGAVGTYASTSTNHADYGLYAHFNKAGFFVPLTYNRNRSYHHAVRLASVVSELTHALKNSSKTYFSFHLLFLPVSGRSFWPFAFEEVGSRGNYVSTTSAQSDDSRVAPRLVRFDGAAFSASYKSWIARFSRFSVRLVSVVSELTVAPKSRSNTHSNHLLFLSAAMLVAEMKATTGSYAYSSKAADGWFAFLFRADTFQRHGHPGAYGGRSVRLVSVVSELTVAPKSFSNTCSSPSHLLFLPAAGYRYYYGDSWLHGSNALSQWSVSPGSETQSGDFHATQEYFEILPLMNRRSGISVRLCSVVSELAFTPKSLSKAYSNHLLFLPAAYLVCDGLDGREGGYYHSVSSSSDVLARLLTYRHYMFEAASLGWAARQARKSVRLASVVSDLTIAPKSHSNTYSNHLLFLPAAGWRDASGIGMQSRAVSLWTSTAQAVGSAYWLRTTEKEFLLQGIASWLFSAVRLASVVSELTVAPKSRSNTHSNHLLFLPATGWRNASEIYNVSTNVFVWHVDCDGDRSAYYIRTIFTSALHEFAITSRSPFGGLSVRLVSVVSELTGVIDVKNRGDRGSLPYGESLGTTTSGTLIPSIVASNPFDFAISDACIRTYFDNSHNFHPNGGEYKSAISSCFHEWLCLEGRKNYWSFVTVPPLGYNDKRKQVSVLGLDTCYPMALLNHHSAAKVAKKNVKTIAAK